MGSSPQKHIALRIDDIGASTKQFEQYTKSRWLNIGPLRHRKAFGAWGPYREMNAKEWESVLTLLARAKAKLTVGITAAWVEQDGTLTPFPKKFPEEAKVLKQGMESGLLEIASHGLTHCVLKDKAFLPGWWGNNRKAHREFWDWLPASTHLDHLKRSQEILTETFGKPVTTLIPPGNVFSPSTLKACQETGIQLVNCQNPKHESVPGTRVIGNDSVLAFHDRELVLFGIAWLEEALKKTEAQEFRFVREL